MLHSRQIGGTDCGWCWGEGALLLWAWKSGGLARWHAGPGWRIGAKQAGQSGGVKCAASRRQRNER